MLVLPIYIEKYICVSCALHLRGSPSFTYHLSFSNSHLPISQERQDAALSACGVPVSAACNAVYTVTLLGIVQNVAECKSVAPTQEMRIPGGSSRPSQRPVRGVSSRDRAQRHLARDGGLDSRAHRNLMGGVGFRSREHRVLTGSDHWDPAMDIAFGHRAQRDLTNAGALAEMSQAWDQNVLWRDQQRLPLPLSCRHRSQYLLLLP